MPRPRKVIVLPESQIQDSISSGRTTVQMLAAAAGCSVPTMRRWLGENYGDRMTFRREPTKIMRAKPVSDTDYNDDLDDDDLDNIPFYGIDPEDEDLEDDVHHE